MNLFGPERIRDQFGIVYEIEILGYEDTALHGRCIHAEYRRPGTEVYEVGLFRCDRTELLEPLPALEKAA